VVSPRHMGYWQRGRVAFAVGNINDGGLSAISLPPVIMRLGASLFRGEAQNHARLLVFGRNRKAGKVRQVFRNVSS